MRWRPLFFSVNFAVSVVFIVSCVIAVGESLGGGGSPFALLGGVCFVWPALAVAIGEWLLYVRNVRRLERPMGVVCGLVGVLALFAFFANAGEAIVKGGQPPGVVFWLGFAAACFGIAGYGLFCCWKRFQNDQKDQRGFALS